MDKKTINLMLIVVGIGVLGIIVYQALSGGFAREKVYWNPQGVIEAQGDVKQTALNYNALGFRIISENQDMCISPNMLASNIGLYAEGAVDEGREQAETMLGESENLKENHAALVTALGKTRPSHDYFFSGLFMDKKTNPKESFIEANNYYGTYFETLDFYDFVDVMNKINSIASEKTQGNITCVTDEIFAKSSMVFVSALNIKEYFGDDVGQITKSTKDFMGSQTEYYDIEKANAMLYEDDKVVYLSLPLENGYDYEVIMSKEADLTGMTPADIKNYRDSSKKTTVSVSIPMPKVEAQYELKNALKAVGFEAPFRMTTLIKNISDSAKLKVDNMDQSISFELMPKESANEIGGAVAATINVDKPYYYMLSHRDTGCKTVMGKKSI